MTALAVALPGAPSRGHVIANVVLFQLAWFGGIVGAARGLPALGTACIVAVMAWHLLVVARPARELALIACAMAIGSVFDSVLASTGWVVYASGQPVAGLAPYWIVALWGLLAISLNVSMRWLKGRWWLAALMGAVASPVSYAGGVRLGAASFAEPVYAMAMLAVGWAVLMPVLMALADRFDGVRPDRA